MRKRTYVAEITDPITHEVIVVEAATPAELEAAIDAALPGLGDTPDTPEEETR